MNPLVSVVVVSYQTRELILTALATLRTACPGEPYEVIVVDNASTDGSAAAVAAAFPEARVVRLARNVGFGRAVNIGAARARGDWLLMLNPDTEPVGNVIGELLAFTRERPGHGIYAGRTLAPDGSDDGHSVFGPPSLWTLTCFATGLSTLFGRSRLFNREALPWLDRAAPVRVPAASGCLLLVRRTLFSQLGGFTPDYFMYCEDLDLCLRATALGAAPVLVPSARVLHVGGAASTSAGKRVMLLRGQVTFLRLRWSPLRAALGRALLRTGIAVRAAGSRLTGRARYWPQVWRQRRTWLTGWPPADGLPPVEELPPVEVGEPVPPAPRGAPDPEG
ncbi:glycosyltransferase family 2 protein [Micromonospora sp. WMMD1102]|uniref:glycosyltransferase family 2 protein n=1 Tax=Micromonospora sp. WMMD1102 TaxID=3016105 RepID=UPI0024158688|nr:glycosyltransferase family 2 protein [Micromonospora sp. WMMD1102]MDG4789582.1 glycosyltransferase family 2 protein [Micromonospora sp. WMMD1102]